MKQVVFNDDGQWADMVFPNGTYIRIHYRYMKDEHIIFHYDLGVVSGTMKIKPCWMPTYQDVLAQAECGLSEMFLPQILNYLEGEEQRRLAHCQLVVDLYEKKKFKQIQDISWLVYHDIKSNPKRIKEVRKALKLYTKTTKAIAKVKKYLVY
jgi:hypothetical protein